MRREGGCRESEMVGYLRRVHERQEITNIYSIFLATVPHFIRFPLPTPLPLIHSCNLLRHPRGCVLMSSQSYWAPERRQYVHWSLDRQTPSGMDV